MGIYKPSIKIEVEKLPKITSSQVYKSGILKLEDGAETSMFLGSKSIKVGVFSDYFGRFIILSGSWFRPEDGELFQFEQKVYVTKTNLPNRYWFLCGRETDEMRCSKRVGVLSMFNGKFGCRHCLNLTYESNKRGKSSKYKYRKWKERTWEIERLKGSNIKKMYAGRPTKWGRKLEKLTNIHLEDDKRNLSKYYRIECRMNRYRRKHKLMQPEESIFGYLA